MGRMSTGGAWALLLLSTGLASAEDLSMSYVDTHSLSLLEARALQGLEASVPVRSAGAPFTLFLEPNDTLLSNLSDLHVAGLGQVALYRGRIEGRADSWVRLSRVGGTWEGLVWNGTELFAIASPQDLPHAVARKAVAFDTGLAIYPVSDLELASRNGICGVGEEQWLDGAQLYRELVSELREKVAALQVPPEQIQIAFVADFEFRALHGAQTSQQLLSRINALDGIFSEQVGVAILPSEVRVFETPVDPFVATNAEQLLNEFATFRESDATIRAAGLAHLFTGRDLDGNTLGIAYLDSLCEAFGGSGVTSGSAANLSEDTLVAAHEIGHNFGAYHDGEAGSPCSHVANGFLMWPSLNGNDQFSQCSLNTMRPRIDAAACITPSRLGDVTVSVAPTIEGRNREPFDIVIDVGSIGTDAVNDVVLSSPVAPLVVESATTPVGSCSIASGALSCQLGTIPVSETRRVTVRARIDVSGPFQVPIRFTVTASNDRVLTNNQATTQIVVSPAADVALSAPAVVTGFTREALSFSTDLRSLGPDPALGVTVTMNLFINTIVSVSIEDGTCTITDFNAATCTLASIPTGATRRLEVQFRGGDRAGTWPGNVNVAASNDGNSFNNVVAVSIVLASAADASVTVTPLELTLAVGETATYSAVISSIGPQTVNDVVARFRAGSVGAIESIVPQGGSCAETTPPGIEYTCSFGSLPSGTTRRVDVGIRGTRLGGTAAFVNVLASNDDHGSNDSTSLLLNVLHAIDVQLLSPGFVPGMVQTLTSTKRFQIRSLGAQPATGATFTAQLPPSFSISAARVAGGNCSISPPNVTCSLPALLRNTPTTVELDVRSDLAGAFSGNVAVSAPGDQSAGDDAFTATFNVVPFYDVRVAAGGNVGALVDEPFVVVASVMTGPQPVSSVSLQVDLSQLPDVVDAVEPATDCLVAQLLQCNFANLDAHSTREVRITMRGLNTGNFSIPLRVNAPQNFDTNNDQATLAVLLERAPDASILNNADQTVPLNALIIMQPLVRVEPFTRAVNDVTFRATIPSGLTLLSASTDLGSCTSSASDVTCVLGTLQTNTSANMEIRARGSTAGTFTSQWSITASNDSNPSLNTASIAVTVGNATPPPPPPSNNGGGGGGGGLGLATLLALGGLVLRRGVLRHSGTA